MNDTKRMINAFRVHPLEDPSRFLLLHRLPIRKTNK